MRIRAVIFDIYKTLLEVKPPPVDAQERWENLCISTFGQPGRFDLKRFAAECEQVIAREHASARSTGISFPEIFWPAVTKEVLPELSEVSENDCDEFLFQHAQLQRTVRLMASAGEVLKQILQKNLMLGIASNSQPYTLRELDVALSTANLNRNIFMRDISFFSFENGFSKPDPHVFRVLTARLQNFGVSTNEVVMVGDRLDNDIEPARAAGWDVFHVNAVEGLGKLTTVF